MQKGEELVALRVTKDYTLEPVTRAQMRTFDDSVKTSYRLLTSKGMISLTVVYVPGEEYMPDTRFTDNVEAAFTSESIVSFLFGPLRRAQLYFCASDQSVFMRPDAGDDDDLIPMPAEWKKKIESCLPQKN